jgi:hypothetical protein
MIILLVDGVKDAPVHAIQDGFILRALHKDQLLQLLEKNLQKIGHCSMNSMPVKNKGHPNKGAPFYPR